MKVTSGELDALIMLLPRLTLRQLERIDDLVHKEKMRKLDGKPEVKTEVEASDAR